MYIHEYICVSPQHTFEEVNLDLLELSQDGKMVAPDPAIKDVPAGMFRRMSKSVKMGVATGVPILKKNKTDGIIIGTANGGMEDCIKFLNQIIEYDEGLLTPLAFVQSTSNAVAGQLSLLTKNQNYNTTHVHFGLAFENALLDAEMLLSENPVAQYLVGGVDEISSSNYHINVLSGWYDPSIKNTELYEGDKPATIAGEGAAMFLVNNHPEHAIAKLSAIEMLHTTDLAIVTKRFKKILEDIGSNDTVFISGENGDMRYNAFYNACKNLLNDDTITIRFKHACGEYPTATSFAVWLACYLMAHHSLPSHFIKGNRSVSSEVKNIIIYNHYHGQQHSFIRLTAAS